MLWILLTGMMKLQRVCFCLGVRDYIHVVDLALGHVAALSKLEEKCGMKVCSLLRSDTLVGCIYSD